MLSFEEVEEIYSSSDWRLRVCARVWDSYSNSIDRNLTVIARLRDYFPSNSDARVCKPLGDFRKISEEMAYDRCAVYEHWVSVLSEVQYSEKLDKNVSMLKVVYAAFKKNAEIIGIELSKEDVEIGFSFLLYRASSGISAEKEVVKRLKSIYGSAARAAPCEDERFDIDAYIGEIPVSIKSGYALTQKSIEAFRRRGKTTPVVYVGPSSGGGLDYLFPESYVLEVSESDRRIIEKMN